MWGVETYDLTKEYRLGFWGRRRKLALDRLTLRVEQGEIFGLLGPNGAGKTTTLKLLLRLIFPTSGTARILGRPLDDVSMHNRIGYLPENPCFYDHLTAREFLTYAAHLFGIRAPFRGRRVQHLLERVGLAESEGVAIRKFSKGMVQRLGIAQALVNDPELIFLDEPMSGLDPIGRREVRDLIVELRREGKTVVFSTHILSDAEALCDRVAVLSRGRLQGCGELRQLLSGEIAGTEITLEAPTPEVLQVVELYARSLVRTGERLRFDVPPEFDVAAVLEALLRARAKIISLNPIKKSLEDYFLARVNAAPAQAGEAARAEIRMPQ
jgi:ABC-2 type transport system ATP-binding protein